MSYRQATATLPTPWTRHPAVIATAVVGLHVLALWALQTGLLRRAVESVVPAEILVELWSPQPEAAASPAPAPKTPAPKPATAAAPPSPAVAPPVPTPVPVAPAASPVATNPAPTATNSIALDANTARATGQNSVEIKSESAAHSQAQGLPRVEQPSKDADYLGNRPIPYPSQSNRLREEGSGVLSIFVDATGKPQEVKLDKSTGYERLDQAALKAAWGWRFTPGKRDGIPIAMWVNTQFIFKLKIPTTNTNQNLSE